MGDNNKEKKQKKAEKKKPEDALVKSLPGNLSNLILINSKALIRMHSQGHLAQQKGKNPLL